MATLYENGNGIAQDPTRACALYMRASLDQSRPLAAPAYVLMRRSVHGEEFHRCVLMGEVGFHHHFEPVTFALDPGHWIRLDLDSATISYDGRDTRVNNPLLTGGVVFVRVKHTELVVGRVESSRRHFLEIFRWIPGGRGGDAWALLWHVFEVVGNRLDHVTAAELVTASGEQPPASLPGDVSELARLAVNDDGKAEWAVLAGPQQGTAVI